jgi:HKD family nuclease
MNLINAITNEENTDNFEHFLLNSLKKSTSIRIASGYIGIDVFKKTESLLKNIVDNGGTVTLIFGLGRWEGISPNLEPMLRSFHDYIHGIDSKSGVYFCQKDKYHGKIYLFNNSSEKWLTVGSSNFSPTGFGDYHEANLKITNDSIFLEFEEYFNRLLLDNAKPINLLKFPSRKADLTKKEKYKIVRVPDDFRKLPIEFKLQIKITPAAHVNLFAGSGRFVKKSGLYTRRGWYEVEIGITVEEVKTNLINILPNTLGPYYITLIDEYGNMMSANFKRKNTDREDKRTMHELGADFMTGKGDSDKNMKHGRKQLGFYIKDKLIESGLLRYGEVITEDILDMYGNHYLEFRKVPEKEDNFYITFDPA